MAQIFYLHKQNLERVAYIHPEEEIEIDEFHECEKTMRMWYMNLKIVKNGIIQYSKPSRDNQNLSIYP